MKNIKSWIKEHETSLIAGGVTMLITATTGVMAFYGAKTAIDRTKIIVNLIDTSGKVIKEIKG